MKSNRESHDQLQKALQKAQIDILGLDLPEIDFCKVMVDGCLMDMEEIELSPADDLTKENRTNDTKPEGIGEE